MGGMRLEWLAWRLVCNHLENYGIDINHKDGHLHASLIYWGETLVSLRDANPKTKTNAMEHAEKLMIERYGFDSREDLIDFLESKAD